MTILWVLIGMVIVGLIMGFIAGLIWKENRPIGIAGDYIVSVVTAVLVGLVDWYVIPAMGFSQTLVYFGLATEPALACLLVLWLIRKAKQ